MDQITLAKAITDFGILAIIAAIFLGIAIVVSKKVLKDANKDREKIEELNKLILEDNQRQICDLKKDMHSLRGLSNRQFSATMCIAERAVKAIERMNDCVRYCQSDRTGNTPNNPDESDIEAIIAASEDATKTETDRTAIEPKKEDK